MHPKAFLVDRRCRWQLYTEQEDGEGAAALQRLALGRTAGVDGVTGIGPMRRARPGNRITTRIQLYIYIYIYLFAFCLDVRTLTFANYSKGCLLTKRT